MTGAEVRQRAMDAVDARVSGPIRLLILQWILNDAMTIQVTASPDRMVPMPRQPDSLTPEQLARLTGARAFAQVTATSAASLIAVHEWKALGPAAALAASLGVPVVDAQAMKVLSAPDALIPLGPGRILGRRRPRYRQRQQPGTISCDQARLRRLRR
jgi:hypothetical protein